MEDEYEGLNDDEILDLICKRYGCDRGSDEAGVRLMMAKGTMNEKGELRNEDGTVSQY